MSCNNGRVRPLESQIIPPYNYGTAAPTVTLTTEDMQDAVAPALISSGLFTYNDAANSFDIPTTALTGQTPVVNALGTVDWVTLSDSSETVTGVTGGSVVNGTLVKIVGNVITTYEVGVDNPLSLVGISLSSTGPGLSVNVQLDGVVNTTHPTNGPVWAGPNGSLVSTVPTTGPVHLIGRVIGTQLVLEISDPIL